MTCTVCSKSQLVHARAKVQGEYGGHTYVVETMCDICPTCGFYFVWAGDMPEYLAALRHAWEREQKEKPTVQ